MVSDETAKKGQNASRLSMDRLANAIYWAPLPATEGAGAIDFNWSRAVSISCQWDGSFFVSMGTEISRI